LREVSVDGDGGEAILSEDFVKLNGVLDALHEDNDLVEHERVEEVSQFPDFLVVLQLHVKLLQSVQGQFTLIVNEDLKLVLHEFPANGFDFGGHGS
jgi:hypothetical protein